MSLQTQAAEFIKQFEGYSDNAYWDVNAWRIGHGSDTIELPNGTHRNVLQSDVTTRELAAKDLARRISGEYIPKVSGKIGADYWNKLPDNSKIALLDIAYNYGNITKNAIVEAARSGSKNKLALAIVESTYNDNAGLSQNVRELLRGRRAKEAALVKVGVNVGDIKKKISTPVIIGAIAVGTIGLGILTVYLFKRFSK